MRSEARKTGAYLLVGAVPPATGGVRRYVGDTDVRTIGDIGDFPCGQTGDMDRDLQGGEQVAVPLR